LLVRDEPKNALSLAWLRAEPYAGLESGDLPMNPLHAGAMCFANGVAIYE
jgi:hypothetical protein